MENFNFTKADLSNEKQLDQIASLLLETGYYENTAQENKLNLAPVAFHKLQTIKPYINHTYILMKENEIVGFFIAGVRDEIEAAAENITNWRRDDSELVKCLNKIGEFYINEGLETDFVLYGIAIDPKYRGQGFFKILYQHLVNLAKASDCKRIIFTVRDSNPAINIYAHYGAKKLGNIDFTHYFKDKLLKYAFYLN